MPATLRFDPVDVDHLSGDIDVEILDQDDDPNHVLEITMPWKVQVDWRLFGPIAAAIGGTWEVKVFVESIGQGFEGEVGSATKALTDLEAGSSVTNRKYQTIINVPANTPPNTGVYKPVVLITYKNDSGDIMAMAGFSEAPLINFYQSA